MKECTLITTIEIFSFLTIAHIEPAEMEALIAHYRKTRYTFIMNNSNLFSRQALHMDECVVEYIMAKFKVKNYAEDIQKLPDNYILREYLVSLSYKMHWHTFCLRGEFFSNLLVYIIINKNMISTNTLRI